ncbi:single-stranded DNA-binding protein [Bacillus sp. 165]|uniref:single-stranded DNA-binding protein n=1 Tax=Bacillus sp. 165 TaxID=1529117 RepID=UPI001ADAD83B|nr:single-stranded DNA-binding protein [Bacillus sp. 165]MBO9129481.1 single-stranded DNA-binding protein [Bacillus sp. 165]
MNKVVLIGRLTKDPELYYTKQGIAYVRLRLAVSRSFKNSLGQQEADFINCTAWRKPAENIAVYCKKGSLIGVTGRIHNSHYQNEEGKKVYNTEIIADTVTFLDRKKVEA